MTEVDTPILSAHATVDRHIESFAVTSPAGWLHTSPEFPMKRLLAAGSGPIYQICHVFRREEAGRHHNPEFAMLEWYRPGWNHQQLMEEVEALLQACVPVLAGRGFARLPYRQAFQRHAGLDPFTASLDQLRASAEIAQIDEADAADRDFWLDLIMSQRVGPRLGQDAPAFLYDFPASQAALSRIRPGDPPLAERFELFWRGIELANGFYELTDAAEQEARFRADQSARAAQGLPVPPYDRHMIAALAAGMPDCAGVALGLDRLLMLKLGLPDVASALPFDHSRA